VSEFTFTTKQHKCIITPCALPLPPYQLYLLFSYISSCIVSSFEDYRTNEGLINGTAACLLQPWFLAFCFIPCGTRLPTKPIGAGTDMRSPSYRSFKTTSKGAPDVRQTRTTGPDREKPA